jgi:hypothetical protein
MDWVILTYGVIFGLIGLYLITLWLRVSDAAKEMRKRQ